MGKFILMICAFAFLVTSVAGAAHAEVPCNPAIEDCASEHVSSENTQGADHTHKGCDLACAGCHMHCHGHVSIAASGEFSLQTLLKSQAVYNSNLLYISDLIYGLKRPPKASILQA